MSENISRRSLIQGMGILGATGALAGVGSALADEAAAEPAEAAAEPAEGADTGEVVLGEAMVKTPAELEARGESTMSAYELNQYRQALLDSKDDFVDEDGTVVPAVWNKLHALFDSYGVGGGTAETANSFKFIQMMFENDEEQAQAYLDMPMGTLFTAYDYAEKTGRDLQECLDLCEDFADRGLLWRTRRGGVAYFHQTAIVHGVFEYNLDRYYEDGWIDTFLEAWVGQAYGEGLYLTGGSPFYHAIPCSEDVVADEKILINADFREIVDRYDHIAVSPCQCRLLNMVPEGLEYPGLGSPDLKDFTSPLCGHPLETCMSFGEEAEYYIERGVGREVDKEEALSILQRSVDAGMILQACYTKGSEVICSCHGDCCGILSCYVALGPDFMETASAKPQLSRYNLEYDKDSCIQCGACVERCPMFAIALDEEGYPEVNSMCMRCGQCGMVCPAGARKLVAKPEEELPDLPLAMLEDYNLKAAYRFEHNLIS